jgi:hypothetical protein
LTYALQGDSPIVALSFAELLTRLIDNNGQEWYWQREDFVPFGDAYDDEMDYK